jgi:nitrogen regulatory protein PII
VLAKKRYLLGRDLAETRGVFRGETKVTAGADGGMEFLVPKGTNRFHFSGGARFIHGGAALEEIVVPVVTIRHVKGKGKQETATKKVGVQVLGVNHRITVSKYRFRLLQTEPVSDRVKPVTLKVAVYDGDTPVTDIAAVTLDSESGSIDERTREVTLTLEDRTFDKRRPYRLVLRDTETDIELADTRVTIDRAFTDDF